MIVSPPWYPTTSTFWTDYEINSWFRRFINNVFFFRFQVFWCGWLYHDTNSGFLGGSPCGQKFLLLDQHHISSFVFNLFWRNWNCKANDIIDAANCYLHVIKWEKIKKDIETNLFSCFFEKLWLYVFLRRK